MKLRLRCPVCNFEYDLPDHIDLNDGEIITNYPKLWNSEILREYKLMCICCDADIVLHVMKAKANTS